MGIFDSIKNAIFGRSQTASVGAAGVTASASASVTQTAAVSSAAAAPQAAAVPLTPSALQAKLQAMSQGSGQKLNWQTSIVDLMKLVGLDPSLTNRKQLAQELGFTGDTNDSASMNIWLHKAVMDKLAADGGQVPPELRK